MKYNNLLQLIISLIIASAFGMAEKAIAAESREFIPIFCEGRESLFSIKQISDLSDTNISLRYAIVGKRMVENYECFEIEEIYSNTSITRTFLIHEDGRGKVYLVYEPYLISNPEPILIPIIDLSAEEGEVIGLYDEGTGLPTGWTISVRKVVHVDINGRNRKCMILEDNVYYENRITPIVWIEGIGMYTNISTIEIPTLTCDNEYDFGEINTISINGEVIADKSTFDMVLETAGYAPE